MTFSRSHQKFRPLTPRARQAGQLFFLVIFSIFLFPPSMAPAQETFENTGLVYTASEISMWNRMAVRYSPQKMSIVSTSRRPKKFTEVAENVTVVTAEEIEAIGAHTLVDVLNYVTGVQMALSGGPGMHAIPSIQGSKERHVRLIIDGITMNTIGGLFAYWSLVPVQHIEKIEIIKGPASSAWGPFLGGTVNVITKGSSEEPEDSKLIQGVLSGSYGEADTMDFRGEFTGRADNMKYYLSVGKMRTDGLTPGTEFDSDNVYAKVKWDLGEKSDLQFTLGYNEGLHGAGDYPNYGLTSEMDYDIFYSTLNFDSGLWDGANFNLSLRTLQQGVNQFYYLFSTRTAISALYIKETTYGGSAKVTWERGRHSLVMGLDLDSGDLQNSSFLSGGAELDTWAIFANDTISLGSWAITPGVRYDRASTSGGFFSPSIGATWLGLEDTTIIRATVGRGFSIPSLSFTSGATPSYQANPALTMEKVWSYQLGFETTWFEHFFLKADLFRHDVRDVIVRDYLPNGTRTNVNKDRARRQGVELEARTAPIFNTSLFAGFSFIDARDQETGKILDQVARYTGDIGVRYRDGNNLRVDLKGHYIWWWDKASLANGKYNDFIWDLFASKKIWSRKGRDLEIFLNWRNIFNSSQYLYSDLPNPGTWVEGGVRASF